VAALTAPKVIEIGQTFTLDARDSAAGKGHSIRHFHRTNLDADQHVNKPRGTELLTETAEYNEQFDAGGFLPVGTYRFQLSVEDDGGLRSAPVPSTVQVTDTQHHIALASGPATVQLVVVDNLGNASAPATTSMNIIEGVAPTAVLDAPATLGFGASFTLSGVRSFGVGEAVVQWEFTNLDCTGSSNFPIGTPVVTGTGTFNVAVSPATPIGPGPCHVQLVVTDDSGNVSTPATLNMTDHVLRGR
jgi:hypothetical protein